MSSRAAGRRMTSKDHHVVTLMGRLGNQLFQYSFAEWLASTSGIPVRYDLSYLRSLNQLPDKFRDEIEGNIEPGSAHWPTVGGKFDRAARLMRMAKRPTTINFDLSSRGPYLASAPVPSWWVGYWQRLSYAEEAKNQLTAIFDIKPEVIDKERPTCVVHVRRGDYVGLGLAQSAGWYSNAMRAISANTPDVRFIVISDDRAWCRTAFKPAEDLTIGEEADLLDDLRLLARSDFAILSRSTFAWWGAFLGTPQAYYPFPWDSADNVLKNTLIPAHWHPLPVSLHS